MILRLLFLEHLRVAARQRTTCPHADTLGRSAEGSEPRTGSHPTGRDFPGLSASYLVITVRAGAVPDSSDSPRARMSP